MTWVYSCLFLALITSYVTPATTRRLFSPEVSSTLESMSNPETVHHAGSTLLEDRHKYSSAKYKIHDDLGQKALFIKIAPPEWQERNDEKDETTNEERSRRWHSQHQSTLPLPSGWSTNYREAAQAANPEEIEDVHNKFHVNIPAHVTISSHQNGHKRLEDAREEFPVHKKFPGTYSYAQNFRHPQGHDIIYNGDHLHNHGQVFYLTPIIVSEDNNHGGSSSHLGYDYTSIDSREEDTHPSYGYEEATLSDAEITSFQDYFQKGFTLNEEYSVEDEKYDGKWRATNNVYPSKGNAIDASVIAAYERERARPTYNMVSNTLNGPNHGANAGGGLYGFYRNPAIGIGYVTSRGRDSVGTNSAVFFDENSHFTKQPSEFGKLAQTIFSPIREPKSNHEVQSGLSPNTHQTDKVAHVSLEVKPNPEVKTKDSGEPQITKVPQDDLIAQDYLDKQGILELDHGVLKSEEIKQVQVNQKAPGQREAQGANEAQREQEIKSTHKEKSAIEVQNAPEVKIDFVETVGQVTNQSKEFPPGNSSGVSNIYFISSETDVDDLVDGVGESESSSAGENFDELSLKEGQSEEFNMGTFYGGNEEIEGFPEEPSALTNITKEEKLNPFDAEEVSVEEIPSENNSGSEAELLEENVSFPERGNYDVEIIPSQGRLVEGSFVSPNGIFSTGNYIGAEAATNSSNKHHPENELNEESSTRDESGYSSSFGIRVKDSPSNSQLCNHSDANGMSPGENIEGSWRENVRGDIIALTLGEENSDAGEEDSNSHSNKPHYSNGGSDSQEAMKSVNSEEVGNITSEDENSAANAELRDSFTHSSHSFHSTKPRDNSKHEGYGVYNQGGADISSSREHETSHGEQNEQPKYHFRYEAIDKSTGDIKSHEEERYGSVTKGTYSLHEPDGTIRTVEYEVNGLSGFQALVNRTGQTMHHRS